MAEVIKPTTRPQTSIGLKSMKNTTDDCQHYHNNSTKVHAQCYCTKIKAVYKTSL